jgi:hypothetical protein
MSGIISLLVMMGWGTGFLVFVGVFCDLSRRRDQARERRDADEADA